MHKVAVLVLGYVVPLDFGIAVDVFERACLPSGEKLYEVLVCGPKRTVKTHSFKITVPFGLDALARADTIVVPGHEDPNVPVPRQVRIALRSAWDRGARITSICTGAYVLAASGLLAGRRIATHWLYADDFARQNPDIAVEPDVLFIDGGRIVTSAGMSAGIDMCLHLIRRDHGQAVASHTARVVVAPLGRDGAQAQYIRQAPPSSPSSLASLIEWMSINFGARHSVATLADRAGLSERTFARRFREQTGTTPLQWLVAARVQRAQELIEETNASVEQIASLVGFESSVTFRARFRRVIGLTPTEYRRRFSPPN